jgi:hypothetical protein
LLKAVLHQGAIVPLEPLPEWEEGASLEVAKAEIQPVDIDAWVRMMNQLCADSAAHDEEVMRRGIEEDREQAKLRFVGTWGYQHKHFAFAAISRSLLCARRRFVGRCLG